MTDQELLKKYEAVEAERVNLWYSQSKGFTRPLWRKYGELCDKSIELKKELVLQYIS